MTRIDTGLAQVRAEIGALDTKLESRLDSAVARPESKMDPTLARHRADLIKWAFVFWVTALVAIVSVSRR